MCHQRLQGASPAGGACSTCVTGFDSCTAARLDVADCNVLLYRHWATGCGKEGRQSAPKAAAGEHGRLRRPPPGADGAAGAPQHASTRGSGLLRLWQAGCRGASTPSPAVGPSRRRLGLAAGVFAQQLPYSSRTYLLRAWGLPALRATVLTRSNLPQQQRYPLACLLLRHKGVFRLRLRRREAAGELGSRRTDHFCLSPRLCQRPSALQKLQPV